MFCGSQVYAEQAEQGGRRGLRGMLYGNDQLSLQYSTYHSALIHHDDIMRAFSEGFSCEPPEEQPGLTDYSKWEPHPDCSARDPRIEVQSRAQYGSRALRPVERRRAGKMRPYGPEKRHRFEVTS